MPCTIAVVEEGRQARLETTGPGGFETLAGARSSTTEEVADPLRHHGDAEVRNTGSAGLRGQRLPRTSADLAGAGAARQPRRGRRRYPSAEAAEAAVAQRHGRARDEVLATAGAAEAFALVARARSWRRPVVVHPQFTEPHAALEQAGHTVTEVVLRAAVRARPRGDPGRRRPGAGRQPDQPDRRAAPRRGDRALLRRPGRLVVVDEAFMDTVPRRVGVPDRRRRPGCS